MKRALTYLAAGLLLSLASCNKIEEILPEGLSEEEVAAGLKEALRVGTDTSVSQLNAEDGYYGDEAVKILLPPEADVIIDNLSLIPGGPALVEETVKKINRAAEDAAQEAKPIFVEAITNMTIQDAFGILNGNDSSATTYLKDKTYSDLYALFQPDINNSLSKPIILGQSAESAYAALINTYNNAVAVANLLPTNDYPSVTGNSLSAHTTNFALKGLFKKVAEEEQAIRTDPLARVNDILKKVFGN